MEIKCSYSNAVHWDNHAGSLGILPMDSSDANGTAFQFASSTCEASSSSVPSVTGGFTYGEIVIAFFLLLVMIPVAVATFHLLFGRVKIKN
jgi:hypothetical protein